ncbi:MAG: LicD family protein, partial [Chloroflexota bacterium]
MKYRHNTARQFRLLWRHLRFSRLASWGKHNEKKLETLKQLFIISNDFLQDLEVDYWLIHGTLLGYYRSGKPLKGDVDIDFGAPEQAYRKILSAADSLPNGFKLYDTSFNHYGPKLYIAHKGWEADIYFYKPEENLLKPYEKDLAAGYEQPLEKSWIYPLK